jgi:DNA end-binding protein Ku
MARSIWKGAISFGLVTIPVKVYGATEEKDISFRQVHLADGGRVRYKRVCEVCSQEVPFAEIGKGYDAADGRLAILESADFAGLPSADGKTVDVVRFVDVDQVDPTYFNKTYFLEADGVGVKPYVLLRDALTAAGKAAVVKVALRSRESLALIRPVGEVLRLHTMLWPDELRDDSFVRPPTDLTATEPELAMAAMLIEQLSGDFEPDAYTDTYRQELEKVIEAKLDGVALPTGEAEAPRAEVVDLVAALRASVEAAKARRAAAS